jgi:endonuclease YncB( thermonuclease family)
MIRSLLTAAAFVAISGTGATVAHAEPASMVFLNGQPAPVFFNDGDSFRVLSGQFAGLKGRLGGFNTLESHGPVHRWGGWTYKEMYVLAKMATLNARNGVWHCTSDMKTDTYGRTLWDCPDLRLDQVRKGLAHAMSVTEEPADPEVVAAQQEAIAARRGIWAHGVPDYVVTSIHSADEDPTRDWHYNRLVSSADGRSLKWKHRDTYEECAEICDVGYEPEERIDAAVASIKTAAPDVAAAYDDATLGKIAASFAQGQDYAPMLTDPAHAAPIGGALEALRASNAFGRMSDVRSCMIHVDFKRRFGGGKAACLK